MLNIGVKSTYILAVKIDAYISTCKTCYFPYFYVVDFLTEASLMTYIVINLHMTSGNALDLAIRGDFWHWRKQVTGGNWTWWDISSSQHLLSAMFFNNKIHILIV
jgi:hypothetical protein